MSEVFEENTEGTELQDLQTQGGEEGGTQQLPSSDPLSNLDNNEDRTDVETETSFDNGGPSTSPRVTGAAPYDMSSMDRHIHHTNIPEFAKFIRDRYGENGLCIGEYDAIE